jgi:hypothetical protein
MSEPSTSSVDGRALVARPSACLTLAAAMVAVLLFFTGAAEAAPRVPKLLGTNPPSPGAALRPYIIGNAEGGAVISVVSSRAFGTGPVSRDVENPNFEIVIYEEDPTCSNAGRVAATGTAAELESPGIQIDNDVVPGSETFFYAKQVDPADPAHPSECSDGLRYRHVAAPPEEPVFTGTDPSSPAGDNFPNLIGTAPTDTTVAIYDNAGCAGAPIVSGTASAFEHGGIEVTVADNTTTTFYAKSKIAEYTSPCSSSSVTYQQVAAAEEPGGGSTPGEEAPAGGGGGAPNGGGDTGGTKVPDPPGRPPAPTLRTVPGYAANDNDPVLTGKAPGAARVQIYGSAGCKGPVLAEGPASQFTGPGLTLQVADDTTVAFYGISIDGGNDRSQCSSEPAIYIEDSTAPHTRITSGPAATTRKRNVVFRFTDVAGESADTFSCKLDKGRWKPCRAPLKLRGLKLRRHILRVKAVDAAGNEEQGMAKRAFKVVPPR